MKTYEPISPGLRALLTAACVIIVIAGLRAAATILMPLALALFVSVVSLPLLKGLRRLRVPVGLAVFAVVIVDVAAISGFIGLAFRSLTDLRINLPTYLVQLEALEASLIGWMGERGVVIERLFYGDFGQPERLIGILTAFFRGASDLISFSFLVLLFTVFMLAEASTFPRRVAAAAGLKGNNLIRFGGIVREVQFYLGLKTLISLATGLTIGVAAHLLGVDFALLWGLLAFLLNYIPTVGSIIASIPAVLIALVQAGPGTALALILVYFSVNLVFGSLLEPMLIGKRLGLSTLTVLLSLVFWGWMWGPIGMFLSVPLTMAVKIVIDNSEEFRWISPLMAARATADNGEDTVPPILEQTT